MTAPSPDWTDPYRGSRGAWLRGNLHAHAGEGMSTAEVLRAYARRGYDFLSITNHRVPSFPRAPSRACPVLLPGFEWNSTFGEHMNLISLDRAALRRAAACGDQRAVLGRWRSLPGLAILNHPNWQEPPHYTSEQLFERQPATGIEIYNALGETTTGSALATEKWDYVLSRRRPTLGFASDDAHVPVQVGQAWLMARATARTPRAILEALRRGHFYCSTGVSLREIERRGGQVEVRARDADEIWAIGEWGVRLARVAGKQLLFDFEACRKPYARYVRFAAFGRGAAMAWTQPFFRTPPRDDPRFSPFIARWRVSRLLATPLHRVRPASPSRRSLDWTELDAGIQPEGFVDVSRRHGHHHGTALLTAEVRVPRNGTWIACLGHDGAARLFVDDHLVIHEGCRVNPALADRSRAQIRLARGRHRLCVALDTDHGRGQGIFFRFRLAEGPRPSAADRAFALPSEA